MEQYSNPRLDTQFLRCDSSGTAIADNENCNRITSTPVLITTERPPADLSMARSRARVAIRAPPGRCPSRAIQHRARRKLHLCQDQTPVIKRRCDFAMAGWLRYKVLNQLLACHSHSPIRFAVNPNRGASRGASQASRTVAPRSAPVKPQEATTRGASTSGALRMSQGSNDGAVFVCCDIKSFSTVIGFKIRIDAKRGGGV